MELILGHENVACIEGVYEQKNYWVLMISKIAGIILIFEFVRNLMQKFYIKFKVDLGWGFYYLNLEFLGFQLNQARIWLEIKVFGRN